jgi:hypothetical protein
MIPRRPQLTWDQIVEYGFLADFDLHRDSRHDVRGRPWAQPATRALQSKFFKLERAREEITRLNIEIRRVVTHMRDEERYLQQAEANAADDPILQYHIKQYRQERLRFSTIHSWRFAKLAKHPGFTGSLEPGVALDKQLLLHETEGSRMEVDEPATRGEVGDFTAGNSLDELEGGGSDDESDGGGELEARLNVALAMGD